MLSAVLLALLWVLPGISSSMHESDQAAVLGDAWQIAIGVYPEFNGFYNYDKLYISHWLLAALFWVLRRLPGGDLVVAANLLCSIGFAASILVVQVTARLRWQSYALFVTTLLAPTFLLHVPYMAPAFFSATFLALLHVVLGWSRGRVKRRRLVLVALLTFAAVGARADAIFALPFLIWLNVPLNSWPLRIFRKPAVLAVGAGALAAGGVAFCLREPDAVYAAQPSFNAPVFAAYILGGIGGALPLLGWVWLKMGILLRRPGRARLGWVAGIAFLALPFAFYSMQLFSPRYLTLGLVSLLLFLVAPRGRLLASAPGVRPLVALSLLGELLPLSVGAVVPTLHELPRLVTHGATTFPSADGPIPVGAFLAHDFAPRDPALGGARDYNHAVWLAGQRAAYIPDSTGHVLALNTPMYSILRLAMLLQGHKVRRFDPSEKLGAGYSDSRSLLKSSHSLVESGARGDFLGEYIAHSEIIAVSPAFRGIAVQRLEPKAAPGPLRPVWDVLRQIFGGDDFWPREGSEVWDAQGLLRAQLRRGATIAVLSPAPFELILTFRDGREKAVASEPAPGASDWQVVIVSGSATDITSVRRADATDGRQDFISGEAILPDYMGYRRSGPAQSSNL